MQTKQIKPRLTDEELETLKAIAEECEVTSTMLAGFFIRAALRAVKARDGRLLLPPQFELVDSNVGEYRLHERIEKPPPKKAK